MGFRIARAEADRFSIRRDRLLARAPAMKRGGEIEMPRRIVGVDPDGFPTGGNGTLGITQCVERSRKIGKIGRVLPVHRNGLADQFHGDLVLPELIGKDAH